MRFVVVAPAVLSFVFMVVILAAPLLPAPELNVTTETVEISGRRIAQISLAGHPVIRIRTGDPARAQEVAVRLQQVLRTEPALDDVATAIVDRERVVRARLQLIATVGTPDARANASSPASLADQWVTNIRAALQAERARTLRERLIAWRGFLLQVPVVTALLSVVGGAVLTYLWNRAIKERDYEFEVLRAANALLLEYGEKHLNHVAMWASASGNQLTGVMKIGAAVDEREALHASAY